jgi:uncharacterized protein YvpB
MVVFGQMVKYSLSVLLIIGLVFSSGVFSVLLYGKLTDKPLHTNGIAESIVYADKEITVLQTPKPTVIASIPVKKTSGMLKAPLVSQLPELKSGCEITTLSMMLQFYGIQKDKMELLPEMMYDKTAYKKDIHGNIVYWGNPNLGFVGDITGRTAGFGIYHTALIVLLKKYIPTAVDLTGKPFEVLEEKIDEGIPVEVWTTIDYDDSVDWLEWDTSIGPIRATYSEHAVLLVGYDKDNVYVNDPLTGLSNAKVNKALFKRTWEMMEKQAISYTKGEQNNGL